MQFARLLNLNPLLERLSCILILETLYITYCVHYPEVGERLKLYYILRTLLSGRGGAEIIGHAAKMYTRYTTRRKSAKLSFGLICLKKDNLMTFCCCFVSPKYLSI